MKITKKQKSDLSNAVRTFNSLRTKAAGAGITGKLPPKASTKDILKSVESGKELREQIKLLKDYKKLTDFAPSKINIKVGDYYEIPSNEEWNISTISYDNTYKYTYHCMVNNDVLKWGLLNPYEDQEHITLKNEDEWEIEYNRRFKVVTVTPERTSFSTV